jgi:hypothetical protein
MILINGVVKNSFGGCLRIRITFNVNHVYHNLIIQRQAADIFYYHPVRT